MNRIRYNLLFIFIFFLICRAAVLSAQPLVIAVAVDSISAISTIGDVPVADFVKALEAPRDTIVITKTTSWLADTQLLLDDGNDTADLFLGNNGNSDFFWANTFNLTADFDLETIRFFMRTENDADTRITIDVVNGQGDVLFHSSASPSSSPDGSFYDAPLSAANLYSFAAGQAFTIVIGAPSTIRSPAGTDIEGTIRNKSRFSIDGGIGFVNLNTQSDQGLTDGAFLIRALGTLKAPNQPPTAAHPIDDFTLTLGEAPYTVNLNNIFSDGDSDRLYFASRSSDAGTVSAFTHDNILTLNTVSPGQTRVYVSANDGKGGLAIDDVLVTVINRPPEIVHSGVSSAMSGEPIEISASIFDASGISEATLLYRRGGELNFSSAALTRSGESYSSSIPGNAVSSRGIQYRITASDTQNLLTETTLFSVPVQIGAEGVSNTVSTFGRGEHAYRLFSVPINLNSKHPRDVLEDDLETYDDTRWRFFGLRADQSYIEYPNTALMSPGLAFWLAVAESGKTIDTGPGSTVSLAQPFGISLSAGWNFIGNPFDFDVPLVNVGLESTQPLDIRSFEGGWNQHNGSLRPFSGYAVFVNSDDRLLISPFTTGTAASKIVSEFGYDNYDWSVRISAQAQQYKDIDNVAAVAAEASTSWDVLDRPEPPVIGEYISVYFPHPDWGAPTSVFSIDTRPEPYESETWVFEVKTNIHDTIELLFENIDEIPSKFEVWLVDEPLHMAQDLRRKNSYFVAGPLETQPKQLKLMVGHHDVIEEVLRENREAPNDYTLRNYPNPFNPATTIHYGLPDEQHVNVTVYNLLGEKIATLVDGELKTAGHHMVIWDGQNEAGHSVASGLYIYQLRGESVTLTKTMMLVK